MTKHLILCSSPVALLVSLAAVVAPLQGQETGAAGPIDNEAIRPGDVVRLTVIRDKDLSGDFPVNQFGTVVLPLVGEYDVSRESHRSLRDKVIHDLQEIRQARDIEVVVLRRVRIVGEVNEAGVYNLDPTMTVADAVAMAKGRTQYAEEGKLLLRRGSEVIDADLRMDVRVSESPIRSGDEILIPRQGWLDRNAAALIGGATALVGIVVTLVATGGGQ